MRKFRSASLIAMLFSVACMVTTTHVSSRDRADIRGVITCLSHAEGDENILGRLLIEGAKESDTQVDRASVRVTVQTKLLIEEGGERKPAVFADLKEGQHVEARFTGPVLRSYPVQATASEVTILRG